jgi:hypothetical protein
MFILKTDLSFEEIYSIFMICAGLPRFRAVAGKIFNYLNEGIGKDPAGYDRRGRRKVEKHS